MFVERTEEQMPEVPVLRQIAPVALAFVGRHSVRFVLENENRAGREDFAQIDAFACIPICQGQYAGQDGPERCGIHWKRKEQGCITTGTERQSTYDTQARGSGRL